MHVIVIVREAGKLKPDYSLEFDLPELPRKGDYISIQRRDQPAPYGEDMIVQQVWWRLEHPETSGFSSGTPKLGKMGEVYVECSPAVGPWSSAQWRKSLQRAVEQGQADALEVTRMSIPQNLPEAKD